MAASFWASAATVISTNAPLRYLIPTEEPSVDWHRLEFDDQSWTKGTNGLGYDLDTQTNGLQGISAWWSFDDIIDLGKDSSPNANQLVHNGVIPSLTDAARGAAALFLGNSQFVPAGVFPINMPTGNLPYTISIWIKPNPAGTNAGGIMGFLSYGEYGMTRRCNAFRYGGVNDLHNYWFSDDIIRNGNLAGVNFLDGKWHHIVARYEPQTRERTLWADGRQMGSPRYSGPTDSQPINFSIGHTLGFDRYLGLMDEITIWKTALAPNQIAALAQGATPFTLPEYGQVPYAPFLRTDVRNDMHQKKSSVYIRIPFVVDSTYQPDVFTLRAQFDDGLVGYLNGTEIVRLNAPNPTYWNSTAATDRPDNNAVAVEEISLREHASLLVKGTNILSFQLLNASAGSSDLLFVGEVLHEITDTDNDGLPNSWEDAYGFDSFDPETPGADPDQDGLTNAEEFAAGSDPTDPNDPFNNLRLRIEPVQGGVLLSFDASPNKSYSILYKDTLDNPVGDWISLAHFPELSEPMVHSQPESVDGKQTRFYRLVTPALQP